MREGDVPSQDTEPTNCASSPPRRPTPLTVPSHLLWRATGPIQSLRHGSCPGARRVPSPSQPPHHGAEGSGKVKPASRCCREEGTRGRGERVLPARPCSVTVPGRAASRQPRVAPVPWHLLPWCAGAASAGRALAPCPVAVSSRFLLAFFILAPTPPRGTHGEEEAQFPIVSIFLVIVLLGKTQRARLTNIPLFAGYSGGEFRENGSGSPSGQQNLPSASAPSTRTVIFAPVDGCAMVNLMPPHHIFNGRMLLPSFGAPTGHAGGVPLLLRPTGLTLPREKALGRLPRHRRGAGTLPGAKQGHTMGLCSGLPHLLPPPGSISRGRGSSAQRERKTSSVCPQHQRTRPSQLRRGTHGAENKPPWGEAAPGWALGPLPLFRFGCFCGGVNTITCVTSMPAGWAGSLRGSGQGLGSF